MKEEVIREPLWKIRLRLWMRSFKQNWELFREKKLALFGLGVIIFFAIFGALYPMYPVLMKNIFWKDQEDMFSAMKPYDPIIGYDPFIPGHPSPPSPRHPLGTDPLGRDILSQLMYSTPREFTLGITAA
ncbi:MAG TPA: ABC transporter permease, partial [Thermotogales bacterium]|nr:ABC transporter permease [Thermotogales bacterium]